MKTLFRDHGLLLSAVILSLVVTVIYRTYSEDVVDYGLDLIEARFHGLMQDNPSDEEHARILFKKFKKRVMNQEIPPAQVEQMAVHILNLSHAGATLTPEQAEELFIQIEQAAEAQREHTVARASLEELGHELKAVFAFDEALVEACEDDEDLRKKLRKQMRYDFRDGMKIKVDMDMPKVVGDRHRTHLEAALAKMEGERMVAWERDFAKSMEARDKHLAKAMANMEKLKHKQIKQQHKAELKRLEALRHLEVNGVGLAFDADSLQTVIESALEAAEADVESIMEEVEAAMEQVEAEIERAQEEAEAEIERAQENDNDQ